MKKLAFALAFLAITAQASPLQDNMKLLGGIYRKIATTVSDRAHNAENADLAAQMAELFRTMRNEIPDTVSELPAPQQPAAIAEYQRIIDEEVLHSVELRAALLRDDNLAAADAVKALDLERKDGHNKFRKTN